MKVRVQITQKMIDEYRRYNMSPNLFQDYISYACFDSDEIMHRVVSVFVFQTEINITLSPNRTHSFKVPEDLGSEIARYYRERNAIAVDFTLDFRDNFIEVHSIGGDV